MTGPRQAGRLAALAVRAGLQVDAYPRHGHGWTTTVGSLGDEDVEVDWLRRDGRWQLVAIRYRTQLTSIAEVYRLVKKGLR